MTSNMTKKTAFFIIIGTLIILTITGVAYLLSTNEDNDSKNRVSVTQNKITTQSNKDATTDQVIVPIETVAKDIVEIDDTNKGTDAVQAVSVEDEIPKETGSLNQTSTKTNDIVNDTIKEEKVAINEQSQPTEMIDKASVTNVVNDTKKEAIAISTDEQINATKQSEVIETQEHSEKETQIPVDEQITDISIKSATKAENNEEEENTQKIAPVYAVSKVENVEKNTPSSEISKNIKMPDIEVENVMPTEEKLQVVETKQVISTEATIKEETIELNDAEAMKKTFNNKKTNEKEVDIKSQDTIKEAIEEQIRKSKEVLKLIAEQENK
ncbi:MAG: hypothetical protein KAG20_02875 [Cocleimonas sp.]|nr:hypothetical protein [Cocleimonas sp.]